jgi:hypothetical protein
VGEDTMRVEEAAQRFSETEEERKGWLSYFNETNSVWQKEFRPREYIA